MQEAPGGSCGNHTAANVRKAEEAYKNWQQQHSGDIKRTMKSRRDRKSIIRVGTVKIEIVPVGVDGHDGWAVVMPNGGRIEHQTLTQAPANP